MSYLVSARKYRPQTFNEVYEQFHITAILKNAIESKRIAHSFLFTGSRGVGKTSLARILAKALNCVKGPSANPCNKCDNCLEITNNTSTDVVEIDGASNTGVDDVRDLQKELMYVTSSSKYKIYIIDEVHMLSKNAFNALLKTLEEPPANVVFIFATTEPHKVLPTIISRCQRFDFKRISVESIITKLKEICQNERVQIEEEGLYIIAKKADGSMRDALSLVDQVFSLSAEKILAEQILELFGEVQLDVYKNVMYCIVNKDSSTIVKIIHSLIEKGNDLQEFINGFLDYIRCVLLTKLDLPVSEIPPNHLGHIREISECFQENTLLYIISYLIKAKSDIKAANNPILITEVLFIKLTKVNEIAEIEDIVKKLGNSKQADFSYRAPKNDESSFTKDNNLGVKEELKTSLQGKSSENVELSLETFRKDWENLTKHIQYQIRGFAYVYFSNCDLENIEQDNNNNTNITLSCKSSPEYKYLTEKRPEAEKVLSEYYGKNISITFLLKEVDYTPVKKPLPSLDEIREKNPELADFIEKNGGVYSVIQEEDLGHTQ